LINFDGNGIVYGVGFEKGSESRGVVLRDQSGLFEYLGGTEKVVFVPSEEYTKIVWGFDYDPRKLRNARDFKE